MEAKIYDFSQARRDRALTGVVKPKEITDIDRMLNCHDWGHRITKANPETFEYLAATYANHPSYVRRFDPEFYMDADTMRFTCVEVVDTKTGSDCFRFTFCFSVNKDTAKLTLIEQTTARWDNGDFMLVDQRVVPPC